MTAVLSVLAVLVWLLAIICCTNLVWHIPVLGNIVAAVVVATKMMKEEYEEAVRVRGNRNRL